MPRSWIVVLPLVAAGLLAADAAAWDPREGESEFFDQTCVTPTGQAGRCSESPSTTFVITGREIRHAGATTLPEILRRVPGLDVRLITATDGELGLRGFAYEITDRVLVFVDGRAVHIDFFGGTAYEMLPVSLVDIEQIEVVLGPGGSVYGNKAMLGTINIITRSAADYPVAEARVDGGPPGEGRVAARYGAVDGPWSVRATGVGRRVTPYGPGSPAGAGGGTFSASYRPSAGDWASLEVGGMQGIMDMIPTDAHLDRFEGSVGYVRGQGRMVLGGPNAPYGDLNLDVVWNGGVISSETFPRQTLISPGGLRATYNSPYARLVHGLRTRVLGVPLQGRWGGEVRLDTLDSNITSGERSVWNVAAFASEEAVLGRWRLTAGVRVDNSTLTETSVSPRVSVVWSPADGHQIRAAFNTGYNDPNLLEVFGDFPVSEVMSVRPNLHLDAEHLRYGEIGWAGLLTPWLRASANAFAYWFDDWISLDGSSVVPMPGPSPAIPVRYSFAYGNNGPVYTYGGEARLDVPFRRNVSAYADYALVLPHGETSAGYYGMPPHFSPRHKIGGGARVELPMGAYLTADAQYFGQSSVARPDSASCSALYCQSVRDAVVVAHARVGYAWSSGVDVSLAVANALDDGTRQLPGAEVPERRVTAAVAYYPRLSNSRR